MNIKITRTTTGRLVTDGTLEIDGKPFCNTAEATPHRLPQGKYIITTRKDTRYARKMPMAEKAKAASASPAEAAPHATLAPGNGAYALGDATILVGKTLVAGVLLQTRECFDQLYDRIRKSLQRGNAVTLEIKSRKS